MRYSNCIGPIGILYRKNNMKALVHYSPGTVKLSLSKAISNRALYGLSHTNIAQILRTQ